MTEPAEPPPEIARSAAPPARSAWSDRSFRRIWAATAASSFGSEVADIALPLLAVLTLAATAEQVGLLRAAQYVPFLLATLPVGLLVDRYRRHRLQMMVGADLGRFALVAIIPITIWVGLESVELLYVVIFLVGALTVLFQAADFSFLPSVVRPDQVVDANSKIESTYSTSYIAGPGVGGVLVQSISAPGALGVNALGFLASAAFLRGVRVDESRTGAEPGPELESDAAEAAPSAERTGVWSRLVEGTRASGRDVGEGIGVVLRNRYLRPLLLSGTTVNLGYEIFTIGMLLYVVRDLDLGAAAIGLVYVVGGGGSLLGAWFSARVNDRFGFGRVLVVTRAVGDLALLWSILAVTAERTALPVLCAAFALFGVGTAMSGVQATSLRQIAVPEVLRGRVFGAQRTIAWGATPVGAALGGVLVAAFGADVAMVAGAGVVACGIAWVLLSPLPGLRSIHDVPAVVARRVL